MSLILEEICIQSKIKMDNLVANGMIALTRFFMLFLCASVLFSTNAGASFHSIAFYYGQDVPVDELKAFDIAVIHPDVGVDPNTWQSQHSQLYAYLSVGETLDATLSREHPAWIKARNSTWNSAVIDLTNPEWQQYFLEKQFEDLWAKGYRGFFLDTLDSFYLFAQTNSEQQKQIAALESLLYAMKRRHPEAKMILNRGFELLDKVYPLIEAVAAESLFSGWDEKMGRYVTVGNKQRQWLLEQFKKAQTHGIPVVAIDYVDPSDRETARRIAKQIEKLGFIPWVSNGRLTQLGVSTVEVIPRKVLIVDNPNPHEDRIDTPAFRLLAMPLEYMGYVPITHDIRNGFPEEEMVGRYQGVIFWLTLQDIIDQQTFAKWVLLQKSRGLPLVFFSSIPIVANNYLMSDLGMHIDKRPSTIHEISISKQGDSVGFEFQPIPNALEFMPIRIANSDIQLQLKADIYHFSDAIAVTPWGGYALSPYVQMTLPNEQIRWILNPFMFLTQALRLQKLPVPDPSTENGRRIFFSHIDGDGFPSQGEWAGASFTGKILFDRILKKYQLPISVSIIEGEISKDGLYPEKFASYESVARDIFRLPWVEVASHTYSHPFQWLGFSETPIRVPRLPLKNYDHPSLQRELLGSVDYINRRLAPIDKPCRMVFWSGDATVPLAALGFAKKNGLLNLNGGVTSITSQRPSLMYVYPIGIRLAGGIQVFAPVTNENIYTHLWKGPFWGFRNVIDTFKMTDSPRRFKPIDIYYHFYSASKHASLNALIDVYDWALKQKIIPVYASEYVRKAEDFYTTVISRHDDNMIIRNNGALRELRVKNTDGMPDFERSQNIIGFNAHNDDYYIHLGIETETTLHLGMKEPKSVYLSDANARLTQWHQTNNQIVFSLKGHVPIEFSLVNAKNCVASQNNHKIDGIPEAESSMHYKSNQKDLHGITITCYA